MSGSRYFSGYGSSESWGLVMAGGFADGGGTLSSVETTYNGETFASLPDFDIRQSGRESCLVIIDDDRIFMCGGASISIETYIFTNSTGSWQRYKYSQFRKRPSYKIYIFTLSSLSMAKMPTGRISPSCGLVIHPDLGPELVVAGGALSGEVFDTVDIYTVNTDSWREGM